MDKTSHTKNKLSSIIKSEYFKSILYPLVIIELMLLIAYFWSNDFVTTATQNTLINETKINVSEISKRSALVINNEFKSIKDVTKLFQARHTEFFHTFDPKTGKFDDSTYYKTKDGVITNTKKDSQTCTLFYSSVLETQPYRREKAIATQELDPFYNETLQTNDNIVQVYFNSHDSMNRLCPFMEDALGQYPHDIDIPSYNFYYLADKKHNPKKEVVWTDAYLDPAGQGWMISAIAPVYNKRFLEGVVGIDVTLEKIIKNILSVKLPYHAFAMLVDKNGNILAMNEDLEPILGIKELTTHTYDKPVSQTITKPKDFNIMDANATPLTHKLGEMFKSKSVLESFDDDTKQFIITQNEIDETGWKLILLVDEHSLLSNTFALKDQTDKIGYLILAVMALFYVVFFLLVIRRSQRFATQILTPIEDLMSASNALKDNLQTVKLSHSNIYEIDTLIDNFTSMGDNLVDLYDSMQQKIEAGIEQNSESQKMMMYQSRLAAMGEMINMIAHQWRQPITIISMHINNLVLDVEMDMMDPETIKNTVRNTSKHILELSKTIDDFRNFFKPEEMKEEVKLQDVFDDLYTVMGTPLEHHGITFEYPHASPLWLVTYRRELMHVLMHLVKNGQDTFLARKIEDKKIVIDALQEGGEIIITVCDNGGGIDKEIIHKIFDPYFSTKSEKNGVGLGLYMAKTVVENHFEGKISIENHAEGVCVTLILPQTPITPSA